MKKIILILLFVCLLSANAWAIFIVDTGQPFATGLAPSPGGRDPFIPGVNQYSFDSSQQFAGKITLNYSYQISDIETFLYNFDDDNGSVFSYHIALYPDKNNSPDIANEAFQIKVFTDFFRLDGYVWSGVHDLDWVLEEGTYWVGLETRGLRQIPNGSSDQLSGFHGLIAGPVPNPLDQYAFRMYTGGPFDGMYINSNAVNGNAQIGLRVQGSLVTNSNVIPPTPPTAPSSPVAPKSPTAPKPPKLSKSPTAPFSVDSYSFRDVSFDALALDEDPVAAPEPATMALFGAGMAGVFFKRRK